MKRKTKPPCFTCEGHTPTCHAECVAYETWSKENTEINGEIDIARKNEDNYRQMRADRDKFFRKRGYYKK